MRGMMRDEKEGLQKGLRRDLGVMDDEYVHYIILLPLFCR